MNKSFVGLFFWVITFGVVYGNPSFYSNIEQKTFLYYPKDETGYCFQDLLQNKATMLCDDMTYFLVTVKAFPFQKGKALLDMYFQFKLSDFKHNANYFLIKQGSLVCFESKTGAFVYPISWTVGRKR